MSPLEEILATLRHISDVIRLDLDYLDKRLEQSNADNEEKHGNVS